MRGSIPRDPSYLSQLGRQSVDSSSRLMVFYLLFSLVLPTWLGACAFVVCEPCLPLYSPPSPCTGRLARAALFALPLPAFAVCWTLPGNHKTSRTPQGELHTSAYVISSGKFNIRLRKSAYVRQEGIKPRRSRRSNTQAGVLMRSSFFVDFVKFS